LSLGTCDVEAHVRVVGLDPAGDEGDAEGTLEFTLLHEVGRLVIGRAYEYVLEQSRSRFGLEAIPDVGRPALQLFYLESPRGRIERGKYPARPIHLDEREEGPVVVITLPLGQIVHTRDRPANAAAPLQLRGLYRDIADLEEAGEVFGDRLVANVGLVQRAGRFERPRLLQTRLEKRLQPDAIARL
jgi:hypothetical protein